MTPVTGRLWPAVFLGGLIAGALDIAYAMVLAVGRDRPPTQAVKAVASGLLGAEAFQGGAAMTALGFALHFFIALGAAATYVVASRKLGLLRTRIIAPAVIFGPLVYLFMNFIVLPLSAVPFQLSYPPKILIQGFVSHALFVGLPIAWATRSAWRHDS